jgi:hypothetical protein
VSTADLQIVVSGVDWLALIAAGWSLVYFQRILLAASPKPQQVQPSQPEVPPSKVPASATPEPRPRVVLSELTDVPNVVPM